MNKYGTFCPDPGCFAVELTRMNYLSLTRRTRVPLPFCSTRVLLQLRSTIIVPETSPRRSITLNILLGRWRKYNLAYHC